MRIDGRDVFEPCYGADVGRPNKLETRGARCFPWQTESRGVSGRGWVKMREASSCCRRRFAATERVLGAGRGASSMRQSRARVMLVSAARAPSTAAALLTDHHAQDSHDTNEEAPRGLRGYRGCTWFVVSQFVFPTNLLTVDPRRLRKEDARCRERIP